MAPLAQRAIGGRRWNWLHQLKCGEKQVGGFVITIALLTKIILVAVKVAKVAAIAARIARTAATIARAARAVKAVKTAVNLTRNLKGITKTGKIVKKVKRAVDKMDLVSDLMPSGEERNEETSTKKSIVVPRGKKKEDRPYRANSIVPRQMLKMKRLQEDNRYAQLERMKRSVANKWTSL